MIALCTMANDCGGAGRRRGVGGARAGRVGGGVRRRAARRSRPPPHTLTLYGLRSFIKRLPPSTPATSGEEGREARASAGAHGRGVAAVRAAPPSRDCGPRPRRGAAVGQPRGGARARSRARGRRRGALPPARAPRRAPPLLPPLNSHSTVMTPADFQLVSGQSDTRASKGRGRGGRDRGSNKKTAGNRRARREPAPPARPRSGAQEMTLRSASGGGAPGGRAANAGAPPAARGARACRAPPPRSQPLRPRQTPTCIGDRPSGRRGARAGGRRRGRARNGARARPAARHSGLTIAVRADHVVCKRSDGGHGGRRLR